MVERNTQDNVWMVTAHAWDIAGAGRAALRTAFITQQEKEYLTIYPQPEIVASNLVATASKITEANGTATI